MLLMAAISLLSDNADLKLKFLLFNLQQNSFK
jgi:hypothetical protein